MIPRDYLLQHYVEQKQSTVQIAKALNCSVNAVSYWLMRHRIAKRSISEALYAKSNPAGDPFKITKPVTISRAILHGLGLGLYLGQGNRGNQYSIKLGSTDPKTMKIFLQFLEKSFGLRRTNLRFGLQIFSNTMPAKALKYWARALNVRLNQFQKVVITPTRGNGMHKKKSEYGVLTVYYHNKKLRDILISQLEKSDQIY